ncbi:MAG: hypothetical protein LBT09_11510 [Planctomycetaceae bacterium]|jgi:Leucine-rich repeat (LRR) protein|nr:hypothetical protein [Planctomycetaceae bacterium]
MKRTLIFVSAILLALQIGCVKYEVKEKIEMKPHPVPAVTPEPPKKPETTTEKPADKPTTPPVKVETPTVKPADKPTPLPVKVETPTVKPADKPTTPPVKPETPTVKPADKPATPPVKVETPTVKPADKPTTPPVKVETPTEKPAGKPTTPPVKVETPTVKPADKPTTLPVKVETPTVKPADKPATPPVVLGPVKSDLSASAKDVIEVVKKLGGSYKQSPDGVLTMINVDGAGLTVETFDLLGKQTELETLQVANFRGLNDTVFKKILGLKKLTNLAITNSVITDASVAALVQSFPLLRSLDLSRNASLTDDSLFHVGKLKGLESLVVNYCSFSEFGLMNIESLPKLRALDIRGNVKISGSGLSIVAKIPSLRSLKHMSNTVDDMAIAELASARNLDTLDMYDFAITDSAGEELSKLPKLSSLVIFRCVGFGSQGLLALRGKPLKRITLRDLSSLDDVGMEAFRELTGLRRLYLHELNSVTDVGMMNLVYLKDLELLDIWSVPSITDKSFESIAKLPNLKSLSIRSTKITDKSIDLLLTLPKLEELILKDNAAITENAKTKLKESKKFKNLDFGSPQK